MFDWYWLDHHYSTTGFGSFVLFTTTFSVGGHSQSQLTQVQSFAGGLSQVCSRLCMESVSIQEWYPNGVRWLHWLYWLLDCIGSLLFVDSCCLGRSFRHLVCFGWLMLWNFHVSHETIRVLLTSINFYETLTTAPLWPIPDVLFLHV